MANQYTIAPKVLLATTDGVWDEITIKFRGYQVAAVRYRSGKSFKTGWRVIYGLSTIAKSYPTVHKRSRFLSGLFDEAQNNGKVTEVDAQ